MKPSLIFRQNAKKHLSLAKREINSKNEERVFYAALELRKAIECITYSKALTYQKDAPWDQIETWQPKKVMELLLKIDPLANKEFTLSYALEDKKKNPIEDFKKLGTERVFNLKQIKDNYDALGHFLHSPSIKQTLLGKKHDLKKIKVRCRKILRELEEVLSSTIWNLDFGVSITYECLKCKNPIKGRLGLLKQGEKRKIPCLFCEAEYELEVLEGKKVKWIALWEDFKCRNPDCENLMSYWPKQVQEGKKFTCPKCKWEYTFCMGIAGRKPKKN